MWMKSFVIFNPLYPPVMAVSPAHYQSRNEFTILDQRGQPIGSFQANIVEGRNFDLKLAEAPGQAANRFGGFGPIEGGTGAFEGIAGIMTDNSTIGIAPFATTGLAELRVF